MCVVQCSVYVCCGVVCMWCSVVSRIVCGVCAAVCVCVCVHAPRDLLSPLVTDLTISTRLYSTIMLDWLGLEF